MPKDKNDGTLLQVRVPLWLHAAIIRIQAKWADDGIRPAKATKAEVIRTAVLLLQMKELGNSGTATFPDPADNALFEKEIANAPLDETEHS